ncbi:histidine--tRNA ligase [Thermaurantimonas aggregans]|uniref:histidine--tRNA ligase n=1 Tax=Thermaurantimonas aggregans TaxID=2173829 RepID=UPI00157FA36D|nr:histidine--tRNA ligase [Thermaurantimonas aggregans]MCX8149252.1 histidine--tRNA ligase [Thermaurantimonas aggregans]
MKPALVQGTRDLSPDMMYKRSYVISVIKEVFEKYAFQPLETPAMERLDTLTGKYGDEGDRLIFRILNSGDFKKEVPADVWQTAESNTLAGLICEKALRYDLTVPFARFVAMNRHAIALPFKRYQIQPVWRADRPQKGRYREFYQCDADVVGSTSLWQEVELALIYAEVFEKLKLPVRIRLNSRKLLNSVALKAGAGEKFGIFITILDKLDKIGRQSVVDEWLKAGFDASGIGSLSSWIFDEKVDLLKVEKHLGAENEGLEEVRFVLEKVKSLNPDAPLLFDPTLARGLDYYTGCIFEVVAEGVAVGSIGGGGRYDNLTGIFGVEGIPGVGISFGLDRILLALEERGLTGFAQVSKACVMVTGLSEEDMPFAAEVAYAFRKAEISTELYPIATKLKKSLEYANKTAIPFVAIIGEDERSKRSFTLKNLKTGEQSSFALTDNQGWMKAFSVG